ncbi:hypothetical protein DITRI_Ditri10aG0092300 [Diplodiscus trichospermus]
MASSSSQAATVVYISSNSKPAENNVNLDPIMHLPLFKAALKGDWESTATIYNPDAATAKIMGSMYPLHVAVGAGKANEFVKKLVDKMSPDELAITNGSGVTALTIAASVGNTDAAKLLVGKNPNLPNIQDMDGGFPLRMAAQSGNRETLLYFLQVIRAKVQPSPFENSSGVMLLRQVILAGFYDVAAYLVQRYPKLATMEGYGLESPLCSIAVKHSAFFSSSELTLWDRFIYSCWSFYSTLSCVTVRHVPLNLSLLENVSIRGDTENPAHNPQGPTWSWFQHFRATNFSSARPVFAAAREKLQTSMWEAIESLVPQVKHIREMKFMHSEALRLVKLLCTEVEGLDPSKAANIFRNPVFVAATHGIPEIVEKIIESFPIAVQFSDKRVEVEMIVPNIYKDARNNGRRTTRMVFTEDNKELVTEGEKWMKDTANSCSVVAALRATVVFAAAITVPRWQQWRPRIPTAILMFLSILTARYAEDDFLQALPKRLIMGLLTLFISITTMMIAFSILCLETVRLGF